MFSKVATSVLSLIIAANMGVSGDGNALEATGVNYGSKTPQFIGVSPQGWQPQPDDYLIVDVTENMGYLVHPKSHRFLEFPLVTGQKRYVYYIGRGYYAGTPLREWEAQSSEIKGDRVTFGKTGRFLRLSYDEKGTPYGIHPYRYEDRMFAEGPRYRSMGCIIVTESMMDLLEETFKVNEESLRVVTLESDEVEKKLVAGI